MALSLSESVSATLDAGASPISAPAEIVEVDAAAAAFGRGRTVTSSFLDCSLPSTAPDGVTVHHTSYIVVYPAACSTREWLATYTIVESCPKKCGPRHPKNPGWIPPNFVVTTVTCNVCATKTQTVTCPNALGTALALVEGDGITATIAVDPTPPAAAPLLDANTLPVDSFSVQGFSDVAPAAPVPSGDLDLLSGPAAGASITFLNNEPAASATRALVGGPAGAGGLTPIATAGAPPAIGLKAGLALLTGISMALLSF